MDYSFYTNRIPGGIAADDRYWESLEEGTFRLSRCAGCREWMWPAHWRCGECGSWEVTWEDVEPVGSVYSWTRTWYAFDRIAERADDVPYVVVLVELPHAGGARILGVLKGDDTALRIGAPVTGSIDPPSSKTKGYATIRWSL
jgi:uncharacterized OB-fold protein